MLRKELVSAVLVLAAVALSAAAFADGPNPPGLTEKTDCPEACQGLKLVKPYCDAHNVCQSADDTQP